jgi:hypothetical protein
MKKRMKECCCLVIINKYYPHFLISLSAINKIQLNRVIEKYYFIQWNEEWSAKCERKAAWSEWTFRSGIKRFMICLVHDSIWFMNEIERINAKNEKLIGWTFFWLKIETISFIFHQFVIFTRSNLCHSGSRISSSQINRNDEKFISLICGVDK